MQLETGQSCAGSAWIACQNGKIQRRLAFAPAEVLTGEYLVITN